MTTKSQLERAADIILPMDDDKTMQISRQLEAVLGESQNQKPLGMADGSITVEQWNALAAVQRGLRALADNIRRAQNALLPALPAERRKAVIDKRNARNRNATSARVEWVLRRND